MSSSWASDPSSDASEQSLEDTNLSENRLAYTSPGPEQEADNYQDLRDPNLAEATPNASTSANPARLTKEEREDAVRVHAIKFNATLEYDNDGQLQPVYSRRQSEFFDDNPSSALWRHRTTFLRDISSSLDQARSSNLSIHLYNTFKLRQQAKIESPDENGFVETKEPPKAWAAWPLPRESVPRNHQQRGREDDDWRIGPYVKKLKRPGDELREILISRATKTGKERFLARVSDSSSDGDEGDGNLKPVVTADDEAADKVLRPSIQHVLGKLDNLLVALHHARSSYVAPLVPQGKKPLRRSKSMHTVGLKGPGAPSTPHSGSEEDSSEWPNLEAEVSELENDGRQKSQKDKAENASVKVRTHFLREKMKKVGPRDWTDVFGIASITGVEPAVMGRLASRCTQFFDTDAELRAVHGGLTNLKETLYLPFDGNSKKPDILTEDGGETRGGLHVDGFLQTIGGNKHWSYLSSKRKQRKALAAEKAIEDKEGNVGDKKVEDEFVDEFDDESVNESNESVVSGKYTGESERVSEGESEEDSVESTNHSGDEDESAEMLEDEDQLEIESQSRP